MRNIDTIVIHCSASNSAHYDFPAIKKDHMENRGWTDIGYHIGIGWKGEVEILRPIHRPGSHVRGRNFTSIGIVLLGHVVFKKEQFESLARVCSMLLSTFELAPGSILPHNKLDSHKTCPSFDVEWWKRSYLNPIIEKEF